MVTTSVLPERLAGLLRALPGSADVAVVRDGARTVVGVSSSSAVRADGSAAFAALDALQHGWWAGFLAYDLGRAVERVPTIAARGPALPDLHLARFDARLVFEPGRPPEVEGEGSGAELLDRATRTHAPEPRERPGLGGWRSSLDRAAYLASVERILEHIRAGDCYQVNLTRRLETDMTMDPVELFVALAERNPAPHTALLRLGDTALVSASPERFLRVDGRAVETRPIKGTHADAHVLVDSAKDRAENVMIVDLARNDLGRVCAYGSIHVPALCALEQHPGLHHLVSTVRGTLRPDVGWGALLRATFPPASVTGCPKPRVLEIIETLEPVRRGVYCGAIGFIDADRDVADFNVAIRTFTMAAGRSFFGVGGGIVADSGPGAEWEETELKAAKLLAVAAGR